MDSSTTRIRWAAIGAAVAVSLGAGGIGISHATTSSGERPIYLPIEPCRLTDTRPESQVGPRAAPLGPNETYTVSGWRAGGDCNLPSGTAGLALNVTAVGATQASFLTVFPAGVDRPEASNLNPTPGQPPTPNAVNIDLSSTGDFSIYNLAGNVDIIVDVVGIYDDHNHDDRYYTQAQADAMITAAKPIAAFDGGDLLVELSETDMVYRSVTIDAPVAGVVAATSSASLLGSTVDPDFVARCSISTEEVHDFDYLQYADSAGGPGNFPSEVIAGTRHIEVEAGTSITINLVCNEFSPSASLSDPALSAIFIPN